METAKKRFYLIDGTALIYRAFFAFIRNPLRDSAGNNTSAIYGVVNSFLKLLTEQQPEKLLISFDLKEPTFRHKITDTYKANRPPAPDELVSQIEPVKEFFRILNVPEIVYEGYEADDVLATLSQKLKQDYVVVIVAGDKDFSQLADETVLLFDPFAERLSGRSDVEEKYGIKPEQFIDYLALIGDSADNITGVKGIGPKGASALLQKYHDLETIYEHLAEIVPPSLRTKLEQGKDSAFLSKELVTLIKDVPLEDKYDLAAILAHTAFKLEDAVNLLPFLKKYEFNSLHRKLAEKVKAPAPQEPPSPQTSPEHKEQAARDKSEQQTLSGLFDEESQEPQVPAKQNDSNLPVQAALDFYTTSNNGYEIISISELTAAKNFLTALSSAAIIACEFILTADTSEVNTPNSFTPEVFICFDKQSVYHLLLDKEHLLLIKEAEDPAAHLFPAHLKIAGAHNLKHLYHLLSKTGSLLSDSSELLPQTLCRLFSCYGYPVAGANTIRQCACKLFDTMLASYLFDAGTPQHTLAAAVKSEFGYQLKNLQECNISLVPLDAPPPVSEAYRGVREMINFYAAQNVYSVYLLIARQDQKLTACGLDHLFYDIELPLTTVLGKMEQTGVFIDETILGEINETISSEIDRITADVYRLAGKEFNINSPQQLSKILFEDMQIAPVKKTKTGLSTDNVVLEKLSEEYEIASTLIDYRQFTKLRSTYIEALPNLINRHTGRIHSSFNQVVTTTGRLSSSNPNLQNIPIRSEAGKQIRKAFQPAPDDDGKERSIIFSADYSQIELRILGIMCKDRSLITAFNNKQDIHAQTAGLIFAKPITMVSQDERRIAKTINFGILYGMGAVKLSREIGVSQKEAKAFIEEYFRKFPRIKEFVQGLVASAKKKGYAETLFGRRLYLPNIHSSSPKYLSEAERVAVNMPIQGTAADIIKIAMVRIDKALSIPPGRAANAPAASEKTLKAKMIIQVHDELVFEVAERVLPGVKEMVVREMKNALPEKYRIIIPLGVDTGTGKNWYESHG